MEKYHRRDDNLGPYGTYVTNEIGDNPDKYRLGIGYIGLGSFKLGIDSETIRSGIQNTTHDLGNWPHFKKLDIQDKFFFEISIGGSTLWDE